MKIATTLMVGLLAISLGACSTFQSLVNPSGQITGEAGTIVSDVKNVCSSVVDDSAGTVEQLISTYPAGTLALAIADNICAAINTIPVAAMKLGDGSGFIPTVVKVNGVNVTFTKSAAHRAQ